MGKLFLCPTPIGNLADMPPRVVEVLNDADLIAAEDTRTSLPLMKHFGIETPMVSYHKYNEKERTEELLEKLRGDFKLALISDAGMPGISDPGEILVARCREEGIEVTALPGPSAFVTALVMSGLPTRSFTFEGFLPQDKKEQKEVLDRLKNASVTTVFYEAPHRLVKTLEALCAAAVPEGTDPKEARRIAAIREISKKFEECKLLPLPELLAYYRENEPRGEFVLVVEGLSREKARAEEQKPFLEMSVEEHMALYSDLPEKEAMKRVAAERGVTKRDIYQALKIRSEE